MITNEEHRRLALNFHLTEAQRQINMVSLEYIGDVVSPIDHQKLIKAYNMILEVRRNYPVHVEPEEDENE